MPPNNEIPNTYSRQSFPKYKSIMLCTSTKYINISRSLSLSLSLDHGATDKYVINSSYKIHAFSQRATSVPSGKLPSQRETPVPSGKLLSQRETSRSDRGLISPRVCLKVTYEIYVTYKSLKSFYNSLRKAL